MKTKAIPQPNAMKLKTVYWIIIAGVVFCAGIMVLRPVPTLAEHELMVIEGKVLNVYEGGIKDVNLELQGRKERFYVNRGLERGLDLNKLKARVLNKQITIKYPDHWNLLNFDKTTIHISKIEHGGETLFTEVK